MRAYRFAILLLILLAGCTTLPATPPRIDGSTPATFDASWKALESSLDPEQKAKLNTAILLIGATKTHNSGFNGPVTFGPQTLRSELDGKTYEEIIKAGVATGATIGGVSHPGEVPPGKDQ